MFGFGKPKGERLALKIERIMMAMEMAADKGKWDVAVYSSQQLVRTLGDLNCDTDWTEERLTDFLSKRGLVKSITDRNYHQWLVENMPPHLA